MPLGGIVGIIIITAGLVLQALGDKRNQNLPEPKLIPVLKDEGVKNDSKLTD